MTGVAGVSRCPHCDDPIAEGTILCPTCNKDVRPVPRRTEAVAAPTTQANTHGATKRCRFCAEEIQAAAIFCKHCRRDLATGSSPAVVVRSSVRPGIAALLSLVIPGAGQMYVGRVGTGFGWLIFVGVGYATFVLPGFILHILCIVQATDAARRANTMSDASA